MTDYQEFSDAQWDQIKDHLPYGSKGKRGRNANNRRFFNALLWMARSGGRWRDLPARYGNYESVKRRYYLWVEAGVLEALFARLCAEPDTEWLMLDATIVKAHAQAAGARRKKGGLMPMALAAPRAA